MIKLTYKLIKRASFFFEKVAKKKEAKKKPKGQLFEKVAKPVSPGGFSPR